MSAPRSNNLPERCWAEPDTDAARPVLDWFDKLDEFCAVLTPDGVLLDINPAGACCLGTEAARLVGRPIRDLVHPDDLGMARGYLAKLYAEGSGHGDLEFRQLRTDDSVVWVHARLSVDYETPGHPRQLLVNCRNISRRKEVEAALARRLELERLLSSVSVHFVSRVPDRIDAALDDALKAIGRFAGACRSYIFQFSQSGQSMSNTHEWCAEGVTPHIHQLKGLPTSGFAWGLRPILAGEVLHVPSVEQLPPEAAQEKAEFERGGIRSLINVPLVVDGEVIGLLGFDSVYRERAWCDDDLALLRVVAQFAANAIGRCRIEQELRRSAEQVRLLLKYTGEGIFGLDPNGICTLANPACAQMLGYADPAELIGRDMHALTRHSRTDRSPCPVTECLTLSSIREGRPVHVEGEAFWRADNSSFPVEYRSHPIFQDGKVTGAVVTFADITERERARERLTYLAEHDALTALPNRYLFLDRLNSGIARARRTQAPLALLYIDLDDFKPVNDRFGHHQGDLALKGVAERLSRSVREMDTVARIGGDEFAVILEGLPNRAGAEAIAEKIVADLREPLRLQDETVRLGASIGIAMYPGDGQDPDALLRHADLAMYQVKRTEPGPGDCSGP